MIGYVTLGTNDLARAGAFYDAFFEAAGVPRLWRNPRAMAWGAAGAPSLALMLPFDGNTASAGNGVMVALAAGTPEAVDRLHGKALALGAANEGAPGPRGAGFYCAYLRDLDGNKLNIFCTGVR